MSTTPKSIKAWRKIIENTATRTISLEAFLSKTDASPAPKQVTAIKVKQYSKSPAVSILASRPEWCEKEYREAYLEASIEQGIAWQIKINRELRGMSQKELAAILGTQQSAVSRMEDPTYGCHNIETLLNVANAFDCALSVKLVSYSKLAFESERLGENEQYSTPFSIEMEELNGYQNDQEHIGHC